MSVRLRSQTKPDIRFVLSSEKPSADLFSSPHRVFQRAAPPSLSCCVFPALTSSAVVHGAADARAHRCESSHCEVGHVSGLKHKQSNCSSSTCYKKPDESFSLLRMKRWASRSSESAARSAEVQDGSALHIWKRTGTSKPCRQARSGD